MSMRKALLPILIHGLSHDSKRLSCDVGQAQLDAPADN